jgi:hypothetical protein
MVEVLYELTKVTEEGDTVQIKILNVKQDVKYPQGIKYRLALVHNEKRVVGYDNSYPEGHHRHVIKDGKPVKRHYNFVNAASVLKDFKNDVNKWRVGKYGAGTKE